VRGFTIAPAQDAAAVTDVPVMQSVATRPSPDPAVETPTRGLIERLWQLPLLWHSLVLGLLLLGAMAVTLPNQLGNADEGAALSQTELLLEGEGWSVAHPLPGADPEGIAFPIHNSALRVGTDEHVPFSKHPVYPVVLMPFVAAFGVAGSHVASVLGTVAAALAAALIARRLDEGIARPAFWFLGVATPLWFDSFVTIAHTIGAAFVGFAVLLFLRPNVTARIALAGAGLIVLAVLFRTEAILLGIALALVLGARSLTERDRRGVGVAASVLAASAFGHLLDGRLASWVLDGPSVEPSAIPETASFIDGRIGAFMYTVFAGSDRSVAGLLLSTLGVAFVVAAAVVVRRHPEDRNGIFFFLGAAVAVESIRWFVEPNAHIAGLVPAAPLLVGGLVLLDRATLLRRDVTILVATFTAFFVAVVATQYANGGGGGWGGRYFAIGLPLIVPVAVVAVQRAGRTLAPSVRRPAVVMCVAIAAILAWSSSVVLLIDHRLTRSFEETVLSVTDGLDSGDGDDRPVVVSTRPALGRLAYRVVLDQRWIGLRSVDEDVVPYLERLHGNGVRRLVVVTAEPDETVAAVSSIYELVSSHPVTSTDPLGRTVAWSAEVLVLEAVNLP
jgi:hypothetical protein